MSLPIYEASVPVFIAMLRNLSKFLDRGEAFAEERKLDKETLLNWRMAPDMYPLTRQVQLASDFAKGTAARLAGVEVPKYADTEQSFAELKERIAKTIAFLEGLPAESFTGSEAREISLSVRDRELRFRGKSYLLTFGLPNFYFHVTTAYDILRSCGVRLGKLDFLGAT
jgi:hypothetical protein